MISPLIHRCDIVAASLDEALAKLFAEFARHAAETGGDGGDYLGIDASRILGEDGSERLIHPARSDEIDDAAQQGEIFLILERERDGGFVLTRQ